MPTSLSTPITLPTAYTPGATLGPIENLEKIVWQNTGGVVVFQVGRLDPTGRPNFDQTEAELPPGIWGMDKIYGIRFRSRDSGSLATLDPCTGYFSDDPDPFNPGNIPGTTTAITGAVNVQHNGSLIASQPTIDFVDSPSSTFDWNINNDGPNTRVTVQAPDVVTSVFGRVGAVTAQTGDYVAAQVTNAADKSSASFQRFTGGIIADGGAGGIFGPGGASAVYIDTAGRYQSTGPSNAIFSVATSITGDTNYRYTLSPSGSQSWGTGAAATNVSLNYAVTNPAVAHLDLTTPLSVSSVYPDRSAVTLALGGAVAIDYATAQDWSVNITSGAGTVTLSNPLNPPATTQTGFLIIRVANNSGNGETIAWGTNYFFSSVAKPAALAAGTQFCILFILDGTQWLAIANF